MVIKKVFIIFLLLIISMGVVSATEESEFIEANDTIGILLTVESVTHLKI